MEINQLSIFIENKPDSLAALTNIMAENHINMRAISLADSSDFGIVRIIVDNAEEARDILKKNDYIVNLTPVVLVEIPDAAGSLNSILNILSKNGRNIEYMYGFTGKKTNSAYMVMRCTDTAKTEEVLKANKINLVKAENLKEI